MFLVIFKIPNNLLQSSVFM